MYQKYHYRPDCSLNWVDRTLIGPIVVTRWHLSSHCTLDWVDLSHLGQAVVYLCRGVIVGQAVF